MYVWVCKCVCVKDILEDVLWFRIRVFLPFHIWFVWMFIGLAVIAFFLCVTRASLFVASFGSKGWNLLEFSRENRINSHHVWAYGRSVELDQRQLMGTTIGGLYTFKM